MGRRLNRIKLSAASFNTVPPAYRASLLEIPDEDPELPTIESTYTLCYETVFGKHNSDHIGVYASRVIDNARNAECSLRMFMLANMEGWKRIQEDICVERNTMQTKAFGVCCLVQDISIKRAASYSDVCSKKYGAFSINTLKTLLNDSSTDVFSRILHSEVEAGTWYVGYKLHNEGRALEQMFTELEIKLDPFWLAISDDYMNVVLKPYLVNKSGSEDIKLHRFKVTQTIGQLKRNMKLQRAIFTCRQRCLPDAIDRVCTHFRYKPSHFLIEDKPITDMTKVWLGISRAIQQDQLDRLLRGESNLFS